MNAFEDLQAHDENGELREYAKWASPPATAPDDGSILVIKTNQATNNSWLLLAVIRARGWTPGHTLLVTPDCRAHLLGHAMLASYLPPQTQSQAHLSHSQYLSCAGLCNSFDENPLSLLVRNEHHGRASFIRTIGEHLRATNAKLLIIDQPKRCFPRQPKGNRAWPDAIPPSTRSTASTYGITVIVLDST